ncbi:uncharacterized protein LOC124153380 [Ischnura elegans]|uniref:uncharacterized protein LOC124153380 n=1 Tax=Ischnura elegans TaxID=197161 RepID=UPI001ED89574|nr:uncharacterized protein LOC124153380 [Ischnura elegans]
MKNSAQNKSTTCPSDMTNWANKVQQTPKVKAGQNDDSEGANTTRSYASAVLKTDAEGTARKSKYPIDDYLDPSIISDVGERFPLPPLSPPPPSPSDKLVTSAEDLLDEAEGYLTNVKVDLADGKKILDRHSQSPGSAFSGESNTLAVRKIVRAALGSSQRETKNPSCPASANHKEYSPGKMKFLSASGDEKTRVTLRSCRSADPTVEPPVHFHLPKKNQIKKRDNSIKSCVTHSHNLVHSVYKDNRPKESTKIVSRRSKTVGSQDVIHPKSPSILSPGSKNKTWKYEGLEVSDVLTTDVSTPSSTVSFKSKGNGLKTPPNSCAGSVHSSPRVKLTAIKGFSKSSHCTASQASAEVHKHPATRESGHSRMKVNKGVGSDTVNEGEEKASTVDAAVNTNYPLLKDATTSYSREEIENFKSSKVMPMQGVRFSFEEDNCGRDELQENDLEAHIPLMTSGPGSLHDQERGKTFAADTGVHNRHYHSKDTNLSREKMETVKAKKVISKPTVRFSLDEDRYGSDELQRGTEEALHASASQSTHFNDSKTALEDLSLEEEEADVQFARSSRDNGESGHEGGQRIPPTSFEKAYHRLRSTSHGTIDASCSSRDSASGVEYISGRAIRKASKRPLGKADYWSLKPTDPDVSKSEVPEDIGLGLNALNLEILKDLSSPNAPPPSTHIGSPGDGIRSSQQAQVYEEGCIGVGPAMPNDGMLSTPNPCSDAGKEKNAGAGDNISAEKLIEDVALNISFDELVEDVAATRVLLSPKELDPKAYIDGDSLTAFIENVLLGEFKRVIGEEPSYPTSNISDQRDESKANTAKGSKSEVEYESRGDIPASETKRLFSELRASAQEYPAVPPERVYTPTSSPPPTEPCNKDKGWSDMIIPTPPVSPQYHDDREELNECPLVKVATPPISPKKSMDTICDQLNTDEDIKTDEKTPPTPTLSILDYNPGGSSQDEMRFDSVSTPVLTPSVVKISSDQLHSPSNSFSSNEGNSEVEDPFPSHSRKPNKSDVLPQENTPDIMKVNLKPVPCATRKEDDEEQPTFSKHRIFKAKKSFHGEAQPSSKLTVESETQTDANQIIYPSVGAIAEQPEVERSQDFDTISSFSMDPEVEEGSVAEKSIACFSEGEVKFKSSHGLKVVNLDSVSVGEVVSGRLAETATDLQFFDRGASPSSSKPAFGFGLAESWSEGEIRDKWTLIHSNPSSSVASDASKSLGEISEKVIGSISSEGELMLSDQEK